MLNTLEVTGFRCFDTLHFAPIARVNLIVGANNVGKTFLLETLDLLLRGTPNSISEAATRRSEVMVVPLISNVNQIQQFQAIYPDLHFVFFGRSIAPGTKFLIEGTNGQEKISAVGRIETLETLPVRQPGALAFDPQRGFLPTQFLQEPSPIVFNLTFSSGENNKPYLLQVSREGALVSYGSPNNSVPVRFIPTGSISNATAASYWSDIAARPEEDAVLDVLKFLEPELVRIAVVSAPGQSIFARLKGFDRVPLGNLGDGISHILGLATQLVSAAGGTLLIDEIDTGLHVATMAKMWEFILATADQLNVQVFATTHSDDCLRGLAQAIKKNKKGSQDVALHRIEKGNPRTVYYSPDEIVASAENSIEVR
jgi:energy-coupling factor transporter ATP-binding protein EcfA2